MSAQQAQRRLRAKEPSRAPGKQCGLGRSSRGDCTAGSNQTEIQATMWARVACWETLRAWRSEGKGGRRQTCAPRWAMEAIKFYRLFLWLFESEKKVFGLPAFA